MSSPPPIVATALFEQAWHIHLLTTCFLFPTLVCDAALCRQCHVVAQLSAVGAVVPPLWAIVLVDALTFPLCAGTAVAGCHARFKVRESLGVEGEGFQDAVAMCVCQPCAIVQQRHHMAREAGAPLPMQLFK